MSILIREITPTHIEFHHSGSERDTFASIIEHHTKPKKAGGRGWTRCAYTVMLKRDGDTGKMKRIEFPHLGGASREGVALTYSICLLGNFSERKMDSVEYLAVCSEAVAVCARFHIPIARAFGHWEVDGRAHTECPGDQYDMDGLRADITATMEGGDCGGRQGVNTDGDREGGDDSGAARRETSVDDFKNSSLEVASKVVPDAPHFRDDVLCPGLALGPRQRREDVESRNSPCNIRRAVHVERVKENTSEGKMTMARTTIEMLEQAVANGEYVKEVFEFVTYRNLTHPDVIRKVCPKCGRLYDNYLLCIGGLIGCRKCAQNDLVKNFAAALPNRLATEILPGIGKHIVSKLGLPNIF